MLVWTVKEVQLNWAIDFSWIFEDSKSLKPNTTRYYYVQRNRTISPQEIVINNATLTKRKLLLGILLVWDDDTRIHLCNLFCSLYFSAPQTRMCYKTMFIIRQRQSHSLWRIKGKTSGQGYFQCDLRIKASPHLFPHSVQKWTRLFEKMPK